MKIKNIDSVISQYNLENWTNKDLYYAKNIQNKIESIRQLNSYILSPKKIETLLELFEEHKLIVMQNMFFTGKTTLASLLGYALVNESNDVDEFIWLDGNKMLTNLNLGFKSQIVDILDLYAKNKDKIFDLNKGYSIEELIKIMQMWFSKAFIVIDGLNIDFTQNDMSVEQKELISYIDLLNQYCQNKILITAENINTKLFSSSLYLYNNSPNINIHCLKKHIDNHAMYNYETLNSIISINKLPKSFITEFEHYTLVYPIMFKAFFKSDNFNLSNFISLVNNKSKLDVLTFIYLLFDFNKGKKSIELLSSLILHVMSILPNNFEKKQLDFFVDKIVEANEIEDTEDGIDFKDKKNWHIVRDGVFRSLNDIAVVKNLPNNEYFSILNDNSILYSLYNIDKAQVFVISGIIALNYILLAQKEIENYNSLIKMVDEKNLDLLSKSRNSILNFAHIALDVASKNANIKCVKESLEIIFYFNQNEVNIYELLYYTQKNYEFILLSLEEKSSYVVSPIVEVIGLCFNFLLKNNQFHFFDSVFKQIKYSTLSSDWQVEVDYNLAMIYFNKNNFQGAYKLLDKALAQIDKTEHYRKGYILRYLLQLQSHTQNIDDRKKVILLQESKKSFEENNNWSEVIKCLFEVFEMNLKNKKLDLAEQDLNEMEEIIQKHNFAQKKAIHKFYLCQYTRQNYQIKDSIKFAQMIAEQALSFAMEYENYDLLDLIYYEMAQMSYQLEHWKSALDCCDQGLHYAYINDRAFTIYDFHIMQASIFSDKMVNYESAIQGYEKAFTISHKIKNLNQQIYVLKSFSSFYIIHKKIDLAIKKLELGISLIDNNPHYIKEEIDLKSTLAESLSLVNQNELAIRFSFANVEKLLSLDKEKPVEDQFLISVLMHFIQHFHQCEENIVVQYNDKFNHLIKTYPKLETIIQLYKQEHSQQKS